MFTVMYIICSQSSLLLFVVCCLLFVVCCCCCLVHVSVLLCLSMPLMRGEEGRGVWRVTCDV